jgi:uncharacterized protein
MEWTAVPPWRAVPQPTPETQPFWDGCAAGELRLPHCVPCGRPYYPPRLRCPRCGSSDIHWAAVSGRGRLHTYLINERAPAPGWATPYAIAVIELDEGPRMMSNVVGLPADPEHLKLDMAVEVMFQTREGMALPQFRPAEAAAG